MIGNTHFRPRCFRFGIHAALCAASVFAAPSPSVADDPVRDCWDADVYDLDGDGYAVWNAPSSARAAVTWTGGYMPAGWAWLRGDLDDNDADVHPRRTEVAFNGIDDNCDGRVDEPTFTYSMYGYDNTTDGFTMKIRVNDEDVTDVWEASGTSSVPGRVSMNYLAYEVEYQNLTKTGTTRRTGIKRVTSMAVYPSYAQAEIRLSGLLAGQVIRARVQFYRATLMGGTTPVGEQSGWYYSATDWDGTIGRARTRMLLYGFYEYYLSEQLGYVGYLGSTYIDGTRYGADPGEAWCSEYFSWVADHELDGMGHRSWVGEVEEYFECHDAYTEVSDPSDFIDSANLGDYLALDTDGDGDKNHSNIFLAYDADTDLVWTLDGNTNGTSDWSSGGYESRLGGSEVNIRQRDPDQIRGWGKIKSGMLR